jgi:hypothetical protein
MFFNDLYSDIAARFSNWLEVSTSDSEYITDLALDYINRAIGSLLLEAPRGWDMLTKDRYTLTIGGTDGKTAVLPTDCGSILLVYSDPNDDNIPTIRYYSGKDYEIDRSFSTSAGYSASLKFVEEVIYTMYLRYQVIPTIFTGSGTEYSPFPADLVLLSAQRIRCREKGLNNEWQALKGEYDDFLMKFKGKHQNVSECGDLGINDAAGNMIRIPTYDMAGNNDRPVSRYGNDWDVR